MITMQHKVLEALGGDVASSVANKLEGEGWTVRRITPIGLVPQPGTIAKANSVNMVAAYSIVASRAAPAAVAVN